MKMTTNCTTTLRVAILGFAGLIATTLNSHGQTLVDQWTFDQTSSPYSNSVAGGPDMLQNPSTDPAGTTTGETGNPGDNAAVLQYTGATGTSTSLTAAGALPDALGFSFYINPTFIDNYNNFIDESSGGSYGTFQVHALTVDNSVSGQVAANFEFAVRGTGGNQGFAAATLNNITLAYGNWVAVSGQYDPSSGAISLSVGSATDNNTGDLNLLAGNGAQLVVGTDTSIGAYAFGGAVDNLQIYNAAAVPEPATYALAGIGLACLLIFRRHRSI